LEKPCRNQELRIAIQSAVARHQRLQRQRELSRLSQSRLDSLSEIELAVARGIVQGTPNAQLAEQLELGLRTIEKRRQQIFRKLQVDSLPALISLLFQIAPDFVCIPTNEAHEMN
jgi:FixJ family two-component response regulator